MKVLTAAQMREVDRLTIERGIPGLILMENAAMGVVEVMAREAAPLSAQRVAVFCGKGNNGGDGLAVARGLLGRVASLDVILAARPDELTGDAAVNYRMFVAAGGSVVDTVTGAMRGATVVVDALLGTGLKGPPSGKTAELIRAIGRDFPNAKVFAVDLPSGLGAGGDFVRADFTITFTAPKLEHFLAPDSEAVGRLFVHPIGSPAVLIQSDLEVSEPGDFSSLFQPRRRDANKGAFGHVLIVGGAPGKTGAAAMAGLAALRIGAGLATVASAGGIMAPELMTEPSEDFRLDNKTVVAVGPGLGSRPELVRRIFDEFKGPVVVDADGLNSIAGSDFRGGEFPRILTPHPGEMARLCAKTVPQIQADRLETARTFARDRNVLVILKGYRTIIASPDGRAWINPTGTPALAKGGTGDVLTGMIAGLIAQSAADWHLATRAAVWLQGRAGELAAMRLGERSVLATDLFQFFGKSMDELRSLS